VVVVSQLYVHPDGRDGRPYEEHVESVSGREVYTMVDVPIHLAIWSVWYKPKALFMVARSESLMESLPCLISSAGLRMRVTATANTAKMAITTKSSMRVKAFSFLSLWFKNIMNSLY